MPTILFEGKKYAFPEGVTDGEIAEAIEANQVSPAADIGKGAWSGVKSGVAGIIGLPGDVAKGMRWTAEQAGRLVGSPVDQAYIEGKGPVGTSLSPTSDVIEKGLNSVLGKKYEPQTTAGKYARTISSFAPGVLGPGGMVRNLIRFAVAPGAASEAAGQATEGTELEPYARAAGGLFGLGAASLRGGPSTAERAVSDAMRTMTPQKMQEAQQLVADAAQRGVTLTWPEAAQQVTDSATTLPNLQRVAEASQQGGEVMRPIMAQRPQQVQQAFDRQMADIAAVPMQPSQVGPRASEAGTAILENTRRGINRRTQTNYDAARNDLVPERTFNRMMNQVPGFAEALDDVRSSAHLNDTLRGLPDRSVAVLDAVKQQLQQRAQNVASATNPERNMTVSASQTRSAAAVRRAGRRASGPYRQALDEQSRLRQAELRPLQEGIEGRIADAGDTRQAVNALLPENPLPNTAAETGRATARMAAQDTRTTQNLVRSRLEDTFQRASKDIQSGSNEFAGAKGRAALYGNRQFRRNIGEAVRGLPNGAQIATGLDRLMEIFQATGRRQAIGSQTEFNRLLTEQLSGGRVAAEAASSLIGRVNPLTFVRDRYRQWMLGRNMGELARLITDPAHQQRLIELAGLPRGEPRTRVLLAGLVGQMIQDGGGNEGPLEVTVYPSGDPRNAGTR